MPSVKSKPQAKPAASAKTPASELSMFEYALRILTSVCGQLTEVLLTAAAKNVLVVSAQNEGEEALVRISCLIAGLAQGDTVAVPPDMLSSMLKGHKTGTLTVKNNVLILKSGSYSAEINVSSSDKSVSILEPTGEGEDKPRSFTITPELHAALSARLPQMRIEPSHSAMPDVMLSLRFNSKQRLYITYDPLQFCSARDKVPKGEVSPDISLNLPYTKFTTFIRDLPVSNCKVYILPEELIAFSPNFRVRMTLPVIDDSDSSVSPEDAVAMAKELDSEKPSASVSLDAEMLKAFLANSRDLMSVGTQLEFNKAPDGAKITIASPRGKTTMAIKGSPLKYAFSMDHRYVTTLLSKQGGRKKADDEESTTQVSFDLVRDNSAALCRASVTYMAFLNAETSEEAT